MGQVEGLEVHDVLRRWMALHMTPVISESRQHSVSDGKRQVPTGGSVIIKAHPGFAENGEDGPLPVPSIAKFQWQDGPIDYDEGVPNGVTVEALLEACRDRLAFFNESAFRCRENSLAITAIEEALGWLNQRRFDRLQRGVLGKHEK